MRSHPIAAAIVTMTLALSGSASAQIPDPQSSSPNPARPGQHQKARDGSGETITLTGCVRDEKDVKGQHPGIAERLGVNNDYVLTNAALARTGSASGTANDVTMPSTFKITGLAESELKNHVGHQVEVIGHFSEATARDLFNPQGITGPTPGSTGSSTTKESGGSTTGGVTTSSPANSTDRTAPGGSTNGHASPNTDLPQIAATSVRMIAATCSAQ